MCQFRNACLFVREDVPPDHKFRQNKAAVTTSVDGLISKPETDNGVKSVSHVPLAASPTISSGTDTPNSTPGSSCSTLALPINESGQQQPNTTHLNSHAPNQSTASDEHSSTPSSFVNVIQGDNNA